MDGCACRASFSLIDRALSMASAPSAARIGCAWLGKLPGAHASRLHSAAPATGSRSPRSSSASRLMATASQGAGRLDAAAAGRARAAVLGSLLADAATMPLHWICEACRCAPGGWELAEWTGDAAARETNHASSTQQYPAVSDSPCRRPPHR